MGEKTGVLMLIIATLVVGTLFIAINKGSTSEIGEDIRGKMKGIVDTIKGDKGKAEEGVEDDEDVEYNAEGSYVFNIPTEFVKSYVGEPIKSLDEQIEACSDSKKQYREYYDCFEMSENIGNNKSRRIYGEEERALQREIHMDTSKININKVGMYPITYSLKNKKTGQISKVSKVYNVSAKEGEKVDKRTRYLEEGGYINAPRIIVERREGKTVYGSYNMREIEGDIPTLQEMIDAGLVSVYTKERGNLGKNIEGLEMEVHGFDKNVPGYYVMEFKYHNTETGVTYRETSILQYHVRSYIRSSIIRK